MGRHRSGGVAPQGRGKHRAPTNTGKNIAKVTTAAVFLTTPLTMGAGIAEAYPASPAGVLDDIIACESGGDARAQNPSSSASGLYQFIDSTWRAYRGDSTAARAKDATVAEQHAAAQRLYAAQGTTPWNASKHCWAGKSGDEVTIRDEAPKVSKTPHKDASDASKVQTHQAAKPKASQKAVSEAVPGDTYTVKPGDTLSGIELKYGDGDWHDLYEQNRDVIGDNPNLIIPEQILNVKGI